VLTSLGQFVVNEFESFEACYFGTARQEIEIRTFLYLYWRNKIETIFGIHFCRVTNEESSFYRKLDLVLDKKYCAMSDIMMEPIEVEENNGEEKVVAEVENI